MAKRTSHSRVGLLWRRLLTLAYGSASKMPRLQEMNSKHDCTPGALCGAAHQRLMQAVHEDGLVAGRRQAARLQLHLQPHLWNIEAEASSRQRLHRA